MPLVFRVPLSVLGKALPGLGDFPVEYIEESCPEFDKPALFIRGTRSLYIQPIHYPIMEKMFPKMQVIEFDGGHWIHVDQPDGVQRAM
jgi:pimeloyl-ACP methyl ester carboxylesterase